MVSQTGLGRSSDARWRPSAGCHGLLFSFFPGSQTRQRLQAELASQSGAFAEKVKERAQVRMSPAGVGSTEPFSLCR